MELEYIENTTPTNNKTSINNTTLKNDSNLQLLDHQIKHYSNIKNSITKYSRALDASDTGTGKTYISVKICLDLGLIPWVICPKSVVASWLRVIKQAKIKKYNIITYEQLALSTDLINKNNLSDEYDWKFEADDNFKSNKKKNYLFIYDEAHKCKNSKTINSKILLSLSKYPVKILLLSATIIDKPLYFIPFGIVLKLYNSEQEGLDWMSKTISVGGIKNSSNPMIHIHKVLFNDYASRMRIDDTIGVFKENKIFFEGITMKNYWEIEQKYDKINIILEQAKKNKKTNKSTKTNKSNKSKKISDIDEESNDKNIVEEDLYDNVEFYDPDIVKDDESEKKENSLATIQRLRQEIEFLRVDTICEMTSKYLTQQKSVAIFVNFTKTIKELSNRLNCNCIIWGSQTLKERTKSIDDFCSDKSRIIICNTMSGGVGVSLNDTIGNHPRVSIISPTWSAQDLIQVLGRIHRAMGKTDCEQFIIFCKGTIEESVGNVIKQKINNIRSFNDGEKKLKKDNMEVILNNELNKKKKKQEQNEYIYKTNDFDSIQSRIDWFERNLKNLNYELNKYDLHSHEYKECKYRLDKVQKELDYNLKKLNEIIENMCIG
jgi:superfamily II DNA or RNA helicase